MHMLQRLRGGTAGFPRSWCFGFAPSKVGTTALALHRRTLLTESYTRGPTSPPLLDLTIPRHFESVVARHGDRTAVISRAQQERLSFAELDARSTRLAWGLRGRGVGKGERVGVMLGNNWEFAVVTYSLFKLGAILVPLNPAFTSKQVISALNHLEARHLVVGTETNLPYKSPKENISLLREITPNLSSTMLESESVPSLQNVFLVDNSSSRIDTTSFRATVPFQDLISEYPSKTSIMPDSPLHPDDIINIQFTSGTTSAPKAACLTHNSILNNGLQIGDRMGLLPTDIVCCPPPLFHCFGCILGYMATATHGSAILFPSESFNPLDTLLSVQEEQATALYGVTTMFVAELELLANGLVENKGFEHLRTGIAAGSSVPRNVMEKLHRKLNLRGLTICYGMTETSPVSCMTTPTDPMEKRIDSVGKVLPHVEAKVVAVDDHTKILPVGEKGELMVSGYLVMKGYWGDKSRTDEVRLVEHVKEGDEVIGEKVWMCTGDEAEMDADGYVRITGRIKDLIIRGGENIHPLEVENCLFACDSVGEVSVVGVPDEKLGEVVAAFVVVGSGWKAGRDDVGRTAGSLSSAPAHTQDHKPASENSIVAEDDDKVLTPGKLREWVRAHLSNHLVPKYIFWIDAYPKTASGKIQKFKLKEMGIDLLQKARNSGKEISR
ncbi:putative AMP-binding enzyme [Bisporella sp. PMI_857]|nr:putative AMP-binding enzyme [Bisporella sp. PMI_857]